MLEFMKSKPLYCPYCRLKDKVKEKDNAGSADKSAVKKEDEEQYEGPFSGCERLLKYHVMGQHSIEYEIDEDFEELFFYRSGRFFQHIRNKRQQKQQQEEQRAATAQQQVELADTSPSSEGGDLPRLPAQGMKSRPLMNISFKPQNKRTLHNGRSIDPAESFPPKRPRGTEGGEQAAGSSSGSLDDRIARMEQRALEAHVSSASSSADEAASSSILPPPPPPPPGIPIPPLGNQPSTSSVPAMVVQQQQLLQQQQQSVLYSQQQQQSTVFMQQSYITHQQQVFNPSPFVPQPLPLMQPVFVDRSQWNMPVRNGQGELCWPPPPFQSSVAHHQIKLCELVDCRFTHNSITRSSEMRLSHRQCSQLGFRVVDGYVNASTNDYHIRYRANGELRARWRSLYDAAIKGGSDSARQRHAKRKLLVRDRIALVLDPGSELFEVGTIMGHADSLPGSGAGLVTGIGRINGRECLIQAQDATVKGGAVFPIAVQKALRAQRLSRQLRLPTVHLVDSAGAFLPLQAEIFPDRNHGGRTFRYEAEFGAMGLPQLAVVLGSCTAGGAYAPTLTDNSIHVHRIGHVFLGGPPLVKAATGEVVSAEELGGAHLHTSTSGASDYFASTEPDAFRLMRDLVGTVRYEPRALDSGRVDSTAELDEPSLQPCYSSSELAGLAGSTVVGRQFVLQVIARVFDKSEFCEFRGTYGDGLVCGWARIRGQLVGLIAATGRPIKTRSAEKAAHFAQMCDEAGTTLIMMQRSLHGGWDYDHAALKSHAQLMQVLATVRVPRLVLNVGGVVGADHFVLNGRSFEAALCFAWPNAGIREAAADSQLSDDCFDAAHANWCDDVLLPENTRQTLIRCLRVLPRPDDAVLGSRKMLRL